MWTIDIRYDQIILKIDDNNITAWEVTVKINVVF